MQAVETLSGRHNATAFVPAILAGAATQEDPIFAAPGFPVRIKRVFIVPQAAVVGAADHRNLNIVNKGAAGAGVVEIGNLDLAAATNLVAFDETEIPLAADVDLAAHDVLSLQSELVGAGVAVPGLLVVVEYEGLGAF